VGLGALSFLDMSGWLLGFQGRFDRYARIGGDADEAALEMAALIGRRIRFRTFSVDMIAGPALALQEMSGKSESKVFVQAPSSPSSVQQPAPGRDRPERLLLGVRMNLSRSLLRAFIGIDGEFAPAGASDGEVRPDGGRLPVWTVGLALGATAGTQR
jgi:hypothetical protein